MNLLRPPVKFFGPHAENLYGANAETCPAHTRAAGLEPGGPALRTAAPRAHRTPSLRPSPATS